MTTTGQLGTPASRLGLKGRASMKLIACGISSVLIALTLMLSVGVVPVAASTQGSCSGTDTSKVLVYENRIGDTSDYNDSLWDCVNEDVMPMKLTLSYCNGYGMAQWNDCIGSYAVTIPAQQRFCAYWDYSYHDSVIVTVANYGTSAVTKARVNVPTTYNDDWSSHRWIAVGSSC